jgi:hypothetical protein
MPLTEWARLDQHRVLGAALLGCYEFAARTLNSRQALREVISYQLGYYTAQCGASATIC